MVTKRHLISCLGLFLMLNGTQAQTLHPQRAFTHQDTLRGSLNPERTWWDVLRYDISVVPDFRQKTIYGITNISFRVLEKATEMQIDLQEPLALLEVASTSRTVKFVREGNVYHLSFSAPFEIGSEQKIQLTYSGKPREAVRPPWDGGWIWKKDAHGNPWMSVACQGLGASVWYPCKDHQSDEPDNGASLAMVVPDSLVAVGNGRLIEKLKVTDSTSMWRWEVKNPINNYNIIPYIGKYSHFSEVFNGEKGPLDCNYWVLTENLDKARDQFKQAGQMLKCFEYWFGPYPFYEDGYKLVEAPHLGMEHQSATAYGNKYMNGYLGRDLSGSGWGLKWDFIIVHESGHEWFGNNITSKDLADMWLHEGFTNYSETLFTECQFGKQAGTDYVTGTRKNIVNDIPIIGQYGVNQEGSGDMYYKGGNLLHTIRQLIANDSLFRKILRGLNKDFYHQTVTTQQVEQYISRGSGINLSVVFDQYLRTTQVPVLEYKIEGKAFTYRWSNCLPEFNMRVKVTAGKETWLTPTTQWQTQNGGEGWEGDAIRVDRNFFVGLRKLD
jgi:aminopeptidase N